MLVVIFFLLLGLWHSASLSKDVVLGLHTLDWLVVGMGGLKVGGLSLHYLLGSL
jgi:hypothetical protein